jgi:hypothetical protein
MRPLASNRDTITHFILHSGINIIQLEIFHASKLYVQKDRSLHFPLTKYTNL